MTSPSQTLPPATAAARIAFLLLALAGLAIAAGSQWLWRHRQHIAAALVAAVATTYSAGAWGRLQVEALATDSARRLPAQPVAALAPITATLAAAWGAYGLELSDLQRPVPRRYSAAAAIVRFSDGRELSPYSCSMPWFA